MTVEDCCVALAEVETGINRVSDMEMEVVTAKSGTDNGDSTGEINRDELDQAIDQEDNSGRAKTLSAAK